MNPDEAKRLLEALWAVRDAIRCSPYVTPDKGARIVYLLEAGLDELLKRLADGIEVLARVAEQPPPLTEAEVAAMVSEAAGR